MTRMTVSQERRRELVENALASLGPVVIWQQQLDLRISQAIQRDPTLRGLLEPALELTGRIASDVDTASKQLGEIHKDCERVGW
jgi:hypothetical protein